MQIKVKTAQEVVYHVDITPSDTIADVKLLLEDQDASLKADTHRIIFAGRILDDTASLGSARISDGHVLLIVPRTRRSTPDSCEPGSLGQQQEQSYPFIPRLQRRPQVYDPEAGFTVHVGDHTLVGHNLLDSGFLETREGEAMDLVLGVMIGTIMGGLAAICLIEATISTRFKLGILFGISCHVTFAVMRVVLSPHDLPTRGHDV
mmetsp:Transcript_12359/g.31666  ORF Transcript_12359/g.31666 Transcript_12359/m.31666 type:complete len:205 (-) Transcript_12359:986-1600(-)